MLDRGVINYLCCARTWLPYPDQAHPRTTLRFNLERISGVELS